MLRFLECGTLLRLVDRGGRLTLGFGFGAEDPRNGLDDLEFLEEEAERDELTF